MIHFTRALFVLIIAISSQLTLAQEDSLNTSITYTDLIESYTTLSNSSTSCDLISFGNTDSGKPLHLFLLNQDGEFYPEAFKDKAIILIQNGIHAGEPCGIDASLEWATEMVTQNKIPASVIIAIIPVYNVGGMLNRGCCSRANQNGPVEQGFRGNARNLDLNRDFIKNDSENSMAFTRLFHWLKPHIFIDTHTSNGADYQYTMTLLSPRKEKLDAHISNFLIKELEPYIYENYGALSPYVNVFGTTPNSGIHSFNDLPRYSSGYAALFNCIGFTTEAHMWKPFNDRLAHTRKFFELISGFADKNASQLVANKNIADSEGPKLFESLNLKIDTSRYDTLNFLSYQSEKRHSDIVGGDQLYYNQFAPETVKIKYYNYYDIIDEVKVPKYYVVKASWKEVIYRLRQNNITMTVLPNDTTIRGVGSYISSYTSKKSPFEGHYLHQNVTVVDSLVSMDFYSGDVMISTNQPGWRYVLATLEPKAEDSFFAWNFYDEILQQKEWYSSYVFEPYAQQMLDESPLLQAEYDLKLKTDKAFASNGNLRMYWLYKKSPFYEKEHKRVPLLRIY